MRRAIEIFGWYGVCALVLAYLLLSLSVTSSKSLLYQLLNLTGALGIAIEAFQEKDYQPMVVNVVWFVVALAALVSIFWGV